jgi:hypothetical protein
MIHAIATNFLGQGRVEVIVSQASAHADFPQTTLCGSSPTQAVSGNAFIASEVTNPALVPAVVGAVSIPTNGGPAAHQNINAVSLPSDGSVVSTATAASNSVGTVTTGSNASSTSSSYAKAQTVCVGSVVKTSTGCTGTITATAVQSQANSSASGTGASSNDTGTTFLNLVVGTQAITVPVPRNDTIMLPGLGFVVLNEQFCDSPGTLASCSGTNHSGLTVRAIDVVINQGPLAGTEVIVADAHSDATFGP